MSLMQPARFEITNECLNGRLPDLLVSGCMELLADARPLIKNFALRRRTSDRDPRVIYAHRRPLLDEVAQEPDRRDERLPDSCLALRAIRDRPLPRGLEHELVLIRGPIREVRELLSESQEQVERPAVSKRLRLERQPAV